MPSNQKEITVRKSKPVQKNFTLSKLELTKIQSVVATLYSETAKWFPFNPDDIVRKRWSLELYYEMKKDYQIKSLLELKKQCVLGSDFEILPPVDKEGKELKEYEKITEFIKNNIYENYDGNIINDIKALLSAMEFGYSVSELIFKIKNNQILISKIRNVPTDSIWFDIDEYGDLKQDGLKQRTNKGDIVLNQSKFIIFSWDKSDGNMYGSSDLRAVYLPWFAKQQIIKYLNIYLERFGNPFVLGRYESGIDSTETDSLKKVLEYMQSASSALVPKDVEIEFKEASQRGADSFIKAIQLYDQMISIALLVPDLMGLTTTKTSGGSYALGETQFDLYKIIVEKIRMQIEELINVQVIKKLVDYNFSNIKSYPKFKFTTLIKEDELEKVKVFVELIKSNAIYPSDSDLNYIREILKFPLNEEPEMKPKEKEEEKEDDEKSPINSEKNEDLPEDKEDEKEKFALSDTKVFAENLVNFKAIDATFTEKTEIATGRIAKILSNAKKEVIDKIISAQILEKNKLDEVNKIDVPYMGNIKTQLERLFLIMGNEGIKDSRQEIEKQKPEKFGINSQPDISYSAAKEWLNKFALTKAFNVAADINNDIKRKIKNVLMDGFKNGNTTKDIIKKLEQVFEPYTIGAINPENVIDPHRLNTIVRTNASTFYNQGRAAAFKDAVNAEIVTHFQFSAIIDDVTTPWCLELHNTVVPANDAAAISAIQTPIHYNCRSLLIPITKYRQEDMQEAIKSGELKSGLKKPLDWYDGFKSSSQK